MVDNPFTPINCINYKTPPQALELYSPYLTNKFYSYFRETVLIANLGNNFRDMDNDLHFKFYNSIITKKKRFSKWAKSERDEELNIIRSEERRVGKECRL